MNDIAIIGGGVSPLARMVAQALAHNPAVATLVVTDPVVPKRPEPDFSSLLSSGLSRSTYYVEVGRAPSRGRPDFKHGWLKDK